MEAGTKPLEYYTDDKGVHPIFDPKDVTGDSAWHVVGGSGEPAFQNSWSSVGDPYPSAAFRKDAAGNVQLRGRIDGGPADTIVFTLPVSYRPLGRRAFFIIYELECHIEIDSSGNVKVVS